MSPLPTALRMDVIGTCHSIPPGVLFPGPAYHNEPDLLMNIWDILCPSLVGLSNVVLHRRTQRPEGPGRRDACPASGVTAACGRCKLPLDSLRSTTSENLIILYLQKDRQPNVGKRPPS